MSFKVRHISPPLQSSDNPALETPKQEQHKNLACPHWITACSVINDRVYCPKCRRYTGTEKCRKCKCPPTNILGQSLPPCACTQDVLDSKQQ